MEDRIVIPYSFSEVETMKLRLTFIVPLLFCLAGFSQAKGQTITEIVARSGGDFDQNFLDYDILLTAVVTADLADALNDPNDDLTLFAPNDLGFVRTARDLGYDAWSEQGAWEFLVATLTELGEGDPVPVLRDILLYHVAPESLKPYQIIFAKSVPTLQGEVIRPRIFQLQDNDDSLPDPFLFFPLNVYAENGVIHTISRVLIPFNARPTITEVVAKSGGEFDSDFLDYDILLTAVVTADLADALNNPSDDLTLFAPNDLAFIRTARDLGYAGWSEQGAWEFLVAALTELGDGDPIPVLRDILLYHVASERLQPWQVIAARTISTLQGGVIRPLIFRLRDNEPDLPDPFLFFPINIQASNGVIHTISRVLIPVDLP
jgi:uncharacterized surface protein with fasciclin (FAS1) repeats